MIHVFPKEGYLNTTFRVFGDNDQMIRVDLNYDKMENAETQRIITNHIFISPGEYSDITLPAGEIRFCCNSEEVVVRVHDAIKLGGSTRKNSFIFDDNPWCLFVMKDRTYFYNRDTKQEFVESISPDNVEYISKNKLLICNKYKGSEEYSVFDTDRLIAIAHGFKKIYVDENVFVENNEDNELIITDYSSEEVTKLKFEYDEYVIDIDQRYIYILVNNQLSSINLRNLSDIVLIRNISNLSTVTLIDKSSYVELDRTGKYFKIFRIIDNKCIYNGKSESPICRLHNKNIFNFYDYKNKLEEIFNNVSDNQLDKSKLDVVGAANEFKFFPSTDNSSLYIESCKLICRRNFYNGSFNVERIEESFVYSDSTSIVDCSKFYSASKKIVNGDIFLSSYKSLVILRQGEIIFESDSASVIHSQNRNSYYIAETKDGHCKIYTHGDVIELLYCGEIDAQFLSYDLLWYPKELKLLNLNTKKETTGNLRLLGKLSETKNSVYVGGKAIIVNNVLIEGTYNNFPDLETLDSISASGKYILAINENNIYLSVASKQAMEYLYSPVLNKLYDSTKYEKVLFADDGRYMVYSRDGKMYLKDIYSGHEDQLPTTTHIYHINGYMPLVKTDLKRRPVLINPLTMRIINEESLRNFQFVSPNSLFYAKSDQVIKTFNILTSCYITDNEVQNLKNRYNDCFLDNDETKKQKEKLRLELYESHKEVFEFIAKNTICTNNYYSRCFTDIFLKEHGFVYVFSTQNQEQLHEIALGTKLMYLNYISFSPDSRYVAITGKYKDNGGLFLLYDMQLCKEIFKIDGSTNLRVLFKDESLRNTYTKAIWSSAFSKLGVFATYSSDPNLYVIELDGDNVVAKIIEDRSFLAFSSDGKYMALSRQGYIPWNPNEKVNWGHMPSTDVYIHEVSNIESELAHFNDFPDTKVSDEKSYDCICAAKKQTVASVAFSVDNSKLMMVGKDQTVVVRNLHF